MIPFVSVALVLLVAFREIAARWVLVARQHTDLLQSRVYPVAEGAHPFLPTFVVIGVEVVEVQCSL
ncbi:hypothetical protein ARC78_07455 [Stenotrophomonas pictorum JCM 9942]|uniref:Uncharacterized protein n=1 Tax=Stenotrophomonas pictorum JCM 9942 TaxID=1236960 RepID=A0A0R0AN43_9GAMM|nr:hypothetical protein ARC78_07455 [Stenotrophomonas pictorum JCM 9942]